ncbi:MAG: hypothetical protein K0S14_890, partial [Thermomicrobiales bacterium]|nr:hypothetical protein [Thermomicrobiales bacterium]
RAKFFWANRREHDYRLDVEMAATSSNGSGQEQRYGASTGGDVLDRGHDRLVMSIMRWLFLR